jgi:hypothetical protein
MGSFQSTGAPFCAGLAACRGQAVEEMKRSLVCEWGRSVRSTMSEVEAKESRVRMMKG